MAVVEPVTTQRLHHRLHHRVMAHEQDIAVRVAIEPLADTAQRALGHQSPRLAIWRQDGSQPFHRGNAVLVHDFGDRPSLETAEIAFDQAGFEFDRLARGGGDNFGGSHRADQRAADNNVDRDILQPPGGGVRLRNAFVIQGNVGAAPETAAAGSSR